MLFEELFFVVNCVLVMLNQAFGWRRLVLVDTFVVELINLIIESILIDIFSLFFKLLVELVELSLKFGRLLFKLCIEELGSLLVPLRLLLGFCLCFIKVQAFRIVPSPVIVHS